MKLPYPRQQLTRSMVEEVLRQQSGTEPIRFFAWLIAPFLLIPAFVLTGIGIGCWSAWLVFLIIPIYSFGAGARHERRIRATMKRIIAERLCLACGYSLLAQRIDDQNVGTCSECGTPFDIRLYCPSICASCGYDLTGSVINADGRSKCPECGCAYDVCNDAARSNVAQASRL